MTIKKCDICGKTTDHLIELRDDFQVNDIKEVCHKCANEITTRFSDFIQEQQKEKENFIRGFVTKMA